MSPLMVAFRKGHVKVVQHMVQHVRQFPGDQELYRYLTTIAEPDLLRNCKECMDLIVKAKNAQAEEANRAAESLLALLAEEEEAARSKKQAKLRKKEKKKEKKAKKNDGNEKERTTAPTDAPAPVSNAEESPPTSRIKEESEDYSDDGSDSLMMRKERTITKSDPMSRRRSTTLSVCSSVIARVIGRGGANINAIREATGASIEVEKQSAVRRDQHDRQICIRGTQETVRQQRLQGQRFDPAQLARSVLNNLGRAVVDNIATGELNVLLYSTVATKNQLHHFFDDTVDVFQQVGHSGAESDDAGANRSTEPVDRVGQRVAKKGAGIPISECSDVIK
ncbi:unnamed protein product [Nippostrongylus brasiliensis]|uniref:KH domain-containing protein n=1 Tax=Nippostrongylus brasiliensis TaxID=27835 RepID=A0A0N4YTF7_NIPBR|nr:unnamed protein product [Nippostrongylus brasiliensis]